ncbi:hypothetical protein [Halorubrum sp. DTA98]|uniref:DUF7856 family protein n=1 Tax=Halorubrum sp. DTA98 TaxID=3402163 RepID=UPI003AAA8828
MTSPSDLATACGCDEDDGGEDGGTEPPIPDPHDVLGRVPTGETLWRELAAAARSRDHESSVAAEIRELRGELAAVDVPDVDLEAARERLAEATGDEDRLKERVAAARGEVRARRSMDAATDAALAELEEAAAALSIARTERVAAEQALERRRERAADTRDARERRLRLRDRLRNRRRDARRELADEAYPAFREALDAVPRGDSVDAGTRPCEYDGSKIAASLAAVRIAALDEPVVVSTAVLDDLTSARPNAAPETLLDGAIRRPDP